MSLSDNPEERISKGYVSRIPEKRVKTEIYRTKYPRTFILFSLCVKNYKRYNIRVLGMPEGEKRKEQKKYLKQ